MVKMLIEERLEPGGSLIIADISFPDPRSFKCSAKRQRGALGGRTLLDCG
jgi:hypothetical protein